VMIFFFVIFANIDSTKKNYIPVSLNTEYYCHVIAYIIAIIAGFTDFLDGFLARKYNWVSNFGALMDPLADKIFVAATMIMLVDYRIVPAWIVIVILAREFMVTGLRLLATQKGEVISADKWGKFKTFLQMMMLLVGGAHWIKLFGLDLITGMLGPIPLWYIWYFFLMVIVYFTLSSGIGYFIKHRYLYTDNT